MKLPKIYLPYFIIVLSLSVGGITYAQTKNDIREYNHAREQLEKESLQFREEREWEIKHESKEEDPKEDNQLYHPASGSGYIQSVIREVWGKHADIGINLAFCESKFNTHAINGEEEAKKKGITKYSSYGIFQINAPYDEKWFDPRENAKEGYRRFKTQGYRAWFNCSKRLGYL